MTDHVKQRSMLMILIAACKTAQTAFQAADNPVDSGLLQELDRMIARSEQELEALNERLGESSA